MLRHYVFIRYQSETPEEHINEFCRRIHALLNTIPGILELEIGRDILHDQRSWSLMLAMKFQSVETLRRYQIHADHQEVMRFNTPFVQDVASIDFEHPVNVQNRRTDRDDDDGKASVF